MCALPANKGQKRGVPLELCEEATWLGGRTCLLFGSTMKLGRQKNRRESEGHTNREKTQKENKLGFFKKLK